MVERSPKMTRIIGLAGWIWRRSENGASFCHVDKMSPVVRFKP